MPDRLVGIRELTIDLVEFRLDSFDCLVFGKDDAKPERLVAVAEAELAAACALEGTAKLERLVAMLDGIAD